MKKILLAGTALAALTAGGAQAADILRPAPAPVVVAQPAIVGDLSLYGGWFHYSNNSPESFSGSIIGGVGRASMWLAPGLSVQFDLNAENVFAHTDGVSSNYSVVNLAGHLSWRNPAHLLGLFVSYGYNGFWGDRFASVGAEGMLFLGNIHLYAQGGGSFDTTSSPNNSWYIHGEGRYFFNPNLMFAANVGYVGQNEFSTHINIIRWGLDLEWKHATTPFGAFLSYRGTHEREPSESETQNTHAILAGIKLHFNNSSLQWASQNGATLRDFNPETGVNHVLWNDRQ